MSKLKNTYGFSDEILKTIQDIHVNEASLSPKQKKIAQLAGNPEKIEAEDLTKLRTKHKHKHKHKPVQEARTALDKTYPYGANDMATLAVQIRALLNFLSRSGVLKKAMREHTELVEVYIGQEVTEDDVKAMNNLLTTIIEELQQVK